MSNELENIKNCFTENPNGMDLEINHLTAECISSKENNFNIDTEGNLTVKSISATNQNLENQREIATIWPSARPTFTHQIWTPRQIPMDRELIIGTKLTKLGNAIRIGPGVSKVLISAQGHVWSNPGPAFYASSLHVNNTGGAGAIASLYVTSNQMSHSVAPKLVSVTEGSLISLSAQLEGTASGQQFTVISDNGASCWLTVEVVE